MSSLSHDVTDTELSVLQILWDHGPASRRQVAEALYGDAAPASYGTVQKLLERLEAKRFVTKENREGQWAFSATVERAALINHRLLDVANKLCDGATAPLLMNLMRAKPLSADELHALQAELANLTREAQRKR